MLCLLSQNQNHMLSHEDTATIVPGDNHVLCGRGKMNANHTGNKIFANIVRSNLTTYSQAHSRTDKALVVSSVVNVLRGCGLEFIIFDHDSGQYVELSAERVHDKVSHAIRDQIKRNAKKLSQKRALFKKVEVVQPKQTESISCLPLQQRISKAMDRTSQQLSSTIFDLGDKVAEVGVRIEPESPNSLLPSPLSDVIPLELEDLLGESSNLTTSNSSSSSYSPLSLDSETAIDYRDIKTICGILEQQEQDDQAFVDLCSDLLR